MTNKDTNEEKIKTIHLNSWEDFEKQIKEDNEKTPNKDRYGEPYGSVSPLLFRGHGDACWSLETSLERVCRERGLSQEWTWERYFKLLDEVQLSFSSQINRQYDSPKCNYKTSPGPYPPPGYKLMIDLRHHDFPSPLLDWTECYHVAAYFAFEKPKCEEEPKCERVAIYSFRDFAGYQKTSDSYGPWIWVPEAYYKEDRHPRHDNQKAKYTICYKTLIEEIGGKPKGNVYCNHEVASFGNQQDILIKYTLPITIRGEILEKLESMGINQSRLFSLNENLSASQGATKMLKKEAERIFSREYLEAFSECRLKIN